MVHLLSNSAIQLCVQNNFLIDVIKQLYPNVEIIDKNLDNIDPGHPLSVIEINDENNLLKMVKLFEGGISKAIFILPKNLSIVGVQSLNVYFLTKPFKVTSMQKIFASTIKKEPTKLGNLLIDSQSKSLLLVEDGSLKEKIRLTNKEFEIVYFIAEAPGPVLKRDLLQTVFGYSELSHTNTVEVHLHRLKQKLSKHIDISKYIRE